MHGWVRAEDKVARAIARLSELKARMAGMPDAEGLELAEMRRWREEIVARGEVVGEATLPAVDQRARIGSAPR